MTADVAPAAVPVVSVVMAVYDARESIVRAVVSVLEQTFDDLELILVDDASTDGSLDVVRDHLERRGGDPRVRFVSREANGGAAAARNTGVAAATGEFVSFVDSDDEYLPTYLETLVDAATAGTDVVVGNVVYVRPDGSRQERKPVVVGEFPGGRAAELGLLDRITPFTCDKLVRRSLFDGVAFPEGIINEDFLANPVLASRARTVRVVDRAVYLYRVRASSVTWGAAPPVGDLDVAERYLRRALPDPRLSRAIDHAVVFLTMSTAQRAMIRRPPAAQDRATVRECRRRLHARTVLRVARLAPVTALGAVLLKLAPTLYAALYRRHVRRTFGGT